MKDTQPLTFLGSLTSAPGQQQLWLPANFLAVSMYLVRDRNRQRQCHSYNSREHETDKLPTVWFREHGRNLDPLVCMTSQHNAGERSPHEVS